MRDLKFGLKTVLALVMATMFLTSVLWYVFAATPTSTYWVTSGIYPGIPTYTTWIEGSNYFTKDENGLIPTWSGTNNFTVQGIQVLAAISVRGGGYWCIKEGAYTLDGALDIPDNTIVSGVSWVGTQITLRSSGNTEIMFRNDNPLLFASGIGNHNITIQNLLLDGNKANQAGGQGYMGLIDLNNTISATVKQCHIRNSNNHGIRIVNRGVARIMNNWIQFSNGSGIFLGTHSDDSYIAFNDFGSNSLHGVEGSGSGHRHIKHNNVGGNLYDGIKLTGSGGDIVEGNRIMLVARIGIALTRTRNTQIIGNRLLQCDEPGTYFGGGITLDGTVATPCNATLISGNMFVLCYRGIELNDYVFNSTITGNTICETYDRPIYERNNCDYNFISNTNCHILGQPWGLAGQHSVITDSWNGTHFVQSYYYSAGWQTVTLP